MEMPREPSGDTFVGIMTRPVKPDRPEWAPAARRPTGEEYAVDGRENTPANDARAAPEKATAPTPEKTQTLSCVGFRISGQVVSPTASQQSDDCMQRERVGDIGLDADVIDHRSFTGSDIGAELPAAAQLDQGKPDAAVGQASDRNRATLLCAPASASATTTGLHGIAPGRHAERQATPTTARGSRAAVMAGKSDARCNALQRTETQRTATTATRRLVLRNPRRYGGVWRDTNGMGKRTGQGRECDAATRRIGGTAAGVSSISRKPPRWPAAFPDRARKRHAATPLRNDTIDGTAQGHRAGQQAQKAPGSAVQRRSVARHSGHTRCPAAQGQGWRGWLYADNPGLHATDRVRVVYESCTERGDLWTNRVRSVTGCCRRPKNE
jgi:hypothetical protein